MATVKEWFPHDYYASRDVRIMRLLRTGGASWYGLYWLAVEMLHCEDDIREEDVVDGLVMVSRTTHEHVSRFLQFALEQNLFQLEGTVVRSSRVERNLAMRKDISDKKRQAATTRWANKEKTEGTGPLEPKGFVLNGGRPVPMIGGMIAMVSDETREQLHSISNADGLQVQSQNITEQNITEQNKRVSESAAQKARPRSVDEVVAYFATLQMPRSEAQRFHDYYTANGWKVGRNPMKDWQAAGRNWKKGYQDANQKTHSDTARTAPVGIPESIVRLQQKPKLATDELDRIKSIFEAKMGPSDA